MFHNVHNRNMAALQSSTVESMATVQPTTTANVKNAENTTHGLRDTVLKHVF